MAGGRSRHRPLVAAGDRVLVRYRPLDALHAEALGIQVVQPGATSEPGPSLQ